MVRWFAVWKAMRARRIDGIDLTEADRLVTGRCSDPQPYGLGLLLDAAKAPASTEELAGEQQAVTEFVAARRAVLTASPVRRRDAQVRPTVRKVTVKLAAGLALLVIAGVAAETNSLPTALQRHAHEWFSLFGVPAPVAEPRQGDGPSTNATPTPTAPPSGRASDPPDGTGPTTTAVPTLDPKGAKARTLCQAWNSAGRNPDGTTMNSQSWRTLVATAGGKSRVPALCTAVLGGVSAAGAGGPTASTAGAGGPTAPTAGAGRPTAPTAGAGRPTAQASRPGSGPAAPSKPAGGGNRGRTGSNPTR